MTRSQKRWVVGIIVAIVVILRLPTLLPSMYLVDEAYYGTIAEEILDGGAVYHTAVDTKPPGMYYIFAGVFRLAGRNNLFAVHVVAILAVIFTSLVVKNIGTFLSNEWTGAWSGIAYALFVHAFLPRDTLAANSEIFSSLPVCCSVLFFLQAERRAQVARMFLSGALGGAATLIRQPCALYLGVMLASLTYAWLITGHLSLGAVVRASVGLIAGFVAIIAALALYYFWQGNLRDAYLWSFDFAIRYVESETTFAYVLGRLVTLHLPVLVSWAALCYFAIRQAACTLRSLRAGKRVSPGDVLLLLWLVISYLTIFIGWRFPGHYHLVVLPPLSILAGQAFAGFMGEGWRFPRSSSRWIPRVIVGSVTIPVMACFVTAWIVRARTLDFFPLVQQITEGTSPDERIFVWGSYPQLYSFSGRRMATRFVSCTHLVGAYASRPKEVKDNAESIIPGSWEMFQTDWNEHPPALIIDMSTAVSDWRPHPMTRYPALRSRLSGYKAETVVNGATIYRRL